MKGISMPIILQLVGVGVIIAEIILPSGGLLSLLALGIFGYSIYLVFETFSTSIGLLFILVDMITVPILLIVGLKMLAKSPVTLNKQLSKGEGVTSQPESLAGYLDKTGHTLTTLRPAGMARIDGDRVDVVSRGEFIEKDSLIQVIDVAGNQIIVGKSKTKND